MSPVALASVQTCPGCGRPMRRQPRAPLPAGATAPIDTSGLSDTEIYRHYKRTAPVEDLRFFLAHARLSSDLRAAGDALLAAGCRETGGTVSRSEWYRRLTALQDAWRRESADVHSHVVSEELAGVL